MLYKSEEDKGRLMEFIINIVIELKIVVHERLTFEPLHVKIVKDPEFNTSRCKQYQENLMKIANVFAYKGFVNYLNSLEIQTKGIGSRFQIPLHLRYIRWNMLTFLLMHH